MAYKRSHVLVLPFEDRPSQGQIYAHQIATGLNIPTVVLSKPNTNLTQIGGATLSETSDPYQAIVDDFSGEEAEAFILWSESDPHCLATLSACQEAGIPSLDLCLGLAEISPVEGVKAFEKPVEDPTLDEEPEALTKPEVLDFALPETTPEVAMDYISERLKVIKKAIKEIEEAL